MTPKTLFGEIACAYAGLSALAHHHSSNSRYSLLPAHLGVVRQLRSSNSTNQGRAYGRRVVHS